MAKKGGLLSNIMGDAGAGTGDKLATARATMIAKVSAVKAYRGTLKDGDPNAETLDAIVEVCEGAIMLADKLPTPRRDAGARALDNLRSAFLG